MKSFVFACIAALTSAELKRQHTNYSIARQRESEAVQEMINEKAAYYEQ